MITRVRVRKMLKMGIALLIAVSLYITDDGNQQDPPVAETHRAGPTI